MMVDEVRAPFGMIAIAADGPRLASLWFGPADDDYIEHLRGRHGEALKLTRASDPCGLSTKIRAYLAGDLKAFDDIEVAMRGTEFQMDVWRELRRIRVGETVSYGELARRIKRPKAVRAVGLANKQNPIALVVPCHRVIGADGSLTGFGGGLATKSWLLRHEGALLAI